MSELTTELNHVERETYEWQMWVEGFGEEGQKRLKGASVLISRIGGLGGVVAYELAAAGVGKLVLAHAGNLKPSDLNRQLLMSHAGLGTSRVLQAAERLKAFNPRLEIVTLEENVNEGNVSALVSQADLIVDCAPLFEERYALNAEAMRKKKPIVECAMYELEGQVTTMQSGKSPCLRCLHPNLPKAWKREFPVFGAVAGMIGCLGAMEAIKVLSGIGQPLWGEMLSCDLRSMAFRKLRLKQRATCPICFAASSPHEANSSH